jgi:hypothetical protein
VLGQAGSEGLLYAVKSKSEKKRPSSGWLLLLAVYMIDPAAFVIHAVTKSTVNIEAFNNLTSHALLMKLSGEMRNTKYDSVECYDRLFDCRYSGKRYTFSRRYFI